MSEFNPFADDSHVIGADGLTIENGLERISVHGSIEITKDKGGLAHAQRLAEAFGAIAKVLEKEDLPNQIDGRAPEEGAEVKNPF